MPLSEKKEVNDLRRGTQPIYNHLQIEHPVHWPVDFVDTSSTHCSISAIELNISDDIYAGTKIFASNKNAAFCNVLLTAFQTLIYRYTSQEEITLFTLIDDKKHHDVSGSIALSNYIIPLNIAMNGEVLFETLLEKTSSLIGNAVDAKKIFEDQKNGALIKGKQLNRYAGKQTLFIFNKKNETSFSIDILKQIFIDEGLAIDICIIFSEDDQGIDCSLLYNEAIFKESTVSGIANHYKNLLKSVINNRELKIGVLEMLSREEKHSLIYTFNDTIVPYPKNKTIVDLFEEQVLKTPNGIALQQGGISISYAELNEKANCLANYLINAGVQPGDNIGLVVKRTVEMIVSMFAILKTGAAYVPIDPEYPEERQRYILNQSSVKRILIDDEYLILQDIPSEKFIRINNAEIISAVGAENLKLDINSSSLAYTIYTSGSTGKPKGVMIEHHSAVNLILWVNNTFSIGSKDRVLFITSMCFDLSVYDIFGMLSAGGSVVIANEDQVRDVFALQKILHDFQITFWDSVPTTMDYLLRVLEKDDTTCLQNSLRTVFLSGDWIPVDLPNRIKKYFSFASVISLGGATEGTVWSNYFTVITTDSAWKSIPYGKPISNNFFYILNEQMQPVPIGVTGELYIGGVGVARGYANDNEKTAYSFLPDPFNKKAGGMMYRTGDLGRMLPDMNMEFCGRKDSQVKISGFRVELGEVETILTQSNMVHEGAVVAKNDNNGQKRLVGYVVAAENYSPNAIMEYLQSKLPDYMIPAVWIRIQNLPLNANGKIDRKALPDPVWDVDLKDDYKPPVNDLEKSIVHIWKEVLGIEKIGLTDNFFSLGGHSLTAVQIIAKIENQVYKKIPLAVFFKYPTVERLAAKMLQPDIEDGWKSLVHIKPSGSKMPLYIVHGEGLNVLNFNDLATYIDAEQPLYGLQALGLNGVQEPFNDIIAIAKHYVNEIMENDPDGPYAIGGYSFGGYVAVEMRKQFELLGKKVKMLALFDTNAHFSSEMINEELPVIAKRQILKLFWFSKLFVKRPKTMIKYQTKYVLKKIDRTGRFQKSNQTEFLVLVNKIKEKHYEGLRKYKLIPFNDKIYLFKSQNRIYYIDDQNYMGWSAYALKGVNVYEVPGDHETMFTRPHVRDFARILQEALDNC